jgi:hypothetical protein
VAGEGWLSRRLVGRAVVDLDETLWIKEVFMPYSDLFFDENERPYQSGPASLFASHARQAPIYKGQPCYVCAERKGKMIFIGYDEVLGECWGHPACKQKMDEAIVKSIQEG